MISEEQRLNSPELYARARLEVRVNGADRKPHNPRATWNNLLEAILNCGESWAGLESKRGRGGGMEVPIKLFHRMIRIIFW